MYQILLSKQPSAPHITLISADLSHPVSIRIMGNSAEPDFPGGNVFKKENMLSLQSVGRHQFISGKVTRSDYILVRIEK